MASTAPVASAAARKPAVIGGHCSAHWWYRRVDAEVERVRPARRRGERGAVPRRPRCRAAPRAARARGRTGSTGSPGPLVGQPAGDRGADGTGSDYDVGSVIVSPPLDTRALLSFASTSLTVWRPAVKSTALVCCQCSPKRRTVGAMASVRGAGPAGDDPGDPRSGPAPAGHGRARRAVPARGGPGRRPGVVGGLPLLPQPRRAADRADRGGVRRPRRTSSGPRRRCRGAEPAGAGGPSARPPGDGRCEHPHEYALVYGTPVPGYAAPGAHRRRRHPGARRC